MMMMMLLWGKLNCCRRVCPQFVCACVCVCVGVSIVGPGCALEYACRKLKLIIYIIKHRAILITTTTTTTVKDNFKAKNK